MYFDNNVRVRRLTVDQFSFMDSLNFFGSNLGLWPGLGLYQVMEAILEIVLAQTSVYLVWSKVTRARTK